MDALKNVNNQHLQQAFVPYDTKGYSQEINTSKPQIPVYDEFIPMPSVTIETLQKPEIKKTPEKTKFNFENLKTGLKNIPKFIAKTIGGTLGAVGGVTIGLFETMAMLSPVIAPFLPIDGGAKAVIFIAGFGGDIYYLSCIPENADKTIPNIFAQKMLSPISFCKKGAKWGANLLSEEMPKAFGTAFKQAWGDIKKD